MTPIREIMIIRPADIELGEKNFQSCFGSSEMEWTIASMVRFWQAQGKFCPVPIDKVEGGRMGKGVQFLEMRGLLKVAGDFGYPTRDIVAMALRARPSESGILKLRLLEGGQPIEQLLPGTWVQGEVHPHYHVYP